MMLLLGLFSLSGCWVNTMDYWQEADYEREYRGAYCSWSWRCFGEGSGFYSVDDCEERLELAAPGGTDCDYDPEAARDCVGDWLSLSCDAGQTGELPEVCESVHDCPGR